MTRAESLYLLANFISLGLSLGVTFYAYTKRHVQGTGAYVWYAGGQTLWILGFIMGMITPNLGSKIFWEDFQFTAGQLILVAFPVFAIQYTDTKLRNPRGLFRLSLIIPVVFTILLTTDNLHHLIYPNPHLQSAFMLQKLDYDNTSILYAYAVYGYLMLLLGIFFLLRGYALPNKLHRSQIAIIVVGFLIPIIGTVLMLTGVFPPTQHDPTAFTTATGNLIIAWGLYRFRIFNIVPVGRDKIFEAMVEPVVILNNQNLIVDINSSMLALLGKKAEEIIGEPAKKVFDDFPIPIKMYTHVSYARAEATFQISGKDIYYELTVWPLYDSHHKMTGRIYISHDITTLKELERELRDLNIDLEKRVRARTHELADAYDTTLEGWARTLELRDKETEGHSRRVTEITIKVARALEIPEDEIVHIRRGAILHDIGKMAVSDEILRKKDKLTEKERATIEQHPEIARQLLEPITFLKKALDIPYCHHEKWDGTGYPRGLKEREIPVPARIFAIVDVWDAIQSDRPYKNGWSREKAIEYIKEQSGSYFDRRIVNVFLQLVDKGEI
jgi:PAS domain S-box-containing protein/putative nucleotidyltransferase with HDIG domain